MSNVNANVADKLFLKRLIAPLYGELDGDGGLRDPNPKSEAAFEKAVDTYLPLLTGLRNFAEALIDFLVKSSSPEGEYFGDQEEQFKAISEIDWAGLARRLDTLPARYKEAMNAASLKGWFFGWDGSFADIFVLVDRVGNADVELIDETIAGYYREQLDRIGNDLVVRYPDRTAPIRAAIAAHKNFGEDGYYLSVPVFFAQADGLLANLLNVRMPLSGKKSGDALQKMIGQDEDTRDFLNPFFELSGMDFLKSHDARVDAMSMSGNAFTALNRHLVMHGESSEYGTEINSLKALSFLAFAGLHLPSILGAKRK